MRFLLPLAAMAATLLTGCSSLDTNNSSLPIPAIHVGAAAQACGTAGATAITLDAVGTLVTENFPQTGVRHRVEVPGVVTGLAAGESVYGLLIDPTFTCPIAARVELAPAADGTFTVLLSTTGLQQFRVIAISGPAGATVDCPTAGDCVQLNVAGTITDVTGLSNSVTVRLQ